MSPPYNATTTATELVTEYANLIQGKVILTTGVSPGSLGGHFVEAISKASPSCLILAGRSAAKLDQYSKELEKVNPNLRIITLLVDLGCLTSVRKAASYINSHERIPAIDVLVNNAGIMASEYCLSEDGIESQFATNHLGPFLFTNLIMDKILKSESPRVVIVSSDGHRLSPIRFDDHNFDGGKTYNRWVAYGQAKTANMLMALSLASKLAHRGLQAFSLHPGVIFTNLGSHLDWNTDVGLRNLETARDHSGAYLIDAHIADPLVDTVKPWATSSFEAERLWKMSEKLVGQEFAY